MTLWPFIILVSAISFVALILSARKTSRQTIVSDDQQKTEQHFKAQLVSIELDQELGKLGAQEAEAARGELARELVRHRETFAEIKHASDKSWMGALLAGTSLGVVVVAIGVYLTLGMPDQSVLVSVEPPQTQQEAAQNFARVLEQVEAQMAENPDDINGWRVLGPAYIRAARYEEAVIAFRKILELEPPTADAQTDLAEAILLVDDGDQNPEVISLLTKAVALDPTHVRSRFYLAAEATRNEDWDNAVTQWNDLIALSEGEEPWLATAQNGLAIAKARGEPVAPSAPPAASDPEQAELIRSMVARLNERLNLDGGSVDEWTRLVQSYVVMGDLENAQKSYDTAILAYPNANERPQLDELAQRTGLSINNQ